MASVSCWDDFGKNLISFWDDVGIGLGWYVIHVGMKLAPFWDGIGFMLEGCPASFWIKFTLCSNYFRSALGIY